MNPAPPYSPHALEHVKGVRPRVLPWDLTPPSSPTFGLVCPTVLRPRVPRPRVLQPYLMAKVEENVIKIIFLNVGQIQWNRTSYA